MNVFGFAASEFGWTPSQLGELTMRQLWKLWTAQKPTQVEMAEVMSLARRNDARRDKAIHRKLSEYGF